MRSRRTTSVNLRRWVAFGLAFALLVSGSTAAWAACSLSSKIGCWFVGSFCTPAGLAGAQAFRECVDRVSGGECNECLGALDPRDANTRCPDGTVVAPGQACLPYIRSDAEALMAARTFFGPTVAPNQDGRLEAVVVAGDRAGHMWQATPSGAWVSSPTQYVGSPRVTSTPMLARLPGGELDVYVTSPGGAVQHVRQLAPNVNWGGWEAAGGGAVSPLAIAVDYQGRVWLGAARAGGSVWLVSSASAGGPPGSWRSIGGSSAGAPTLAVNADGRLEAFARGPDGAIWHAWDLGGGDAWSAWVSMGGRFEGDPVAAMNIDGRLEVFARAPGGVLRHAWQLAPNLGWSDWADFPGTSKHAVSIAANANGLLSVFVVGVADNSVWLVTQTAGAGGWGTWQSLGGAVRSAPRVARNTDGTLEVLAVGMDGAVWHARQEGPNTQGWRRWERIGGSADPARF